jgi:hypothetical protein
VGGALGDDLAAADHHQLVGDLLDFAQQVRGQQHGSRAVGEVAQEPAHPHDALGVQAVGGLVEDEHLGVAEQRMRDAQPLAHAERVRADALSRGLARQADVVEDRGHAVAPHAERHRGNGERLFAGPSAVLRRGVEEHAHVAARVGDRAVRRAEHGRPPGRRLREPADHPQGRGLAGPVGSDEARDGAGRAAEGDVADRLDGAVALGEVLDFDHGDERAERASPCESATGLQGADQGRRRDRPWSC